MFATNECQGYCFSTSYLILMKSCIYLLFSFCSSSIVIHYNIVCVKYMSTSLFSVAFSTNRLIFSWRDKDPVRINPDLELPQFTVNRHDTENCTDVGEGMWLTDNSSMIIIIYFIWPCFFQFCRLYQINDRRRNSVSIQFS